MNKPFKSYFWISSGVKASKFSDRDYETCHSEGYGKINLHILSTKKKWLFGGLLIIPVWKKSQLCATLYITEDI